jgi:hypothetical protein
MKKILNYNINNELEISYLGKKENIIKFDSESDMRFLERLDFLKKLEQKKIVWKDANKYSKLWYNIKYNKVKYSSDLYKIIISFDSSLKKF